MAVSALLQLGVLDSSIHSYLLMTLVFELFSGKDEDNLSNFLLKNCTRKGMFPSSLTQ